jgi:hypothetical protein
MLLVFIILFYHISVDKIKKIALLTGLNQPSLNLLHASWLLHFSAASIKLFTTVFFLGELC